MRFVAEKDNSEWENKAVLREDLERKMAEYLANGGQVTRFENNVNRVYIELVQVAVLLNVTHTTLRKLCTQSKIPKPDKYQTCVDKKAEAKFDLSIDWLSPVLWYKDKIIAFQKSDEWNRMKSRYSRA